MSKNRLILSFISMVLAIVTFVVATFAWFAIATNVSQSPIDITVDGGHYICVKRF